MIKRTVRSIICTALILHNAVVFSQVKIGDNASTITSNSILELESTDKGLLIPRMALNDVNTVAPLTGAVTEGMLIYSDGGSVSDGFYYWTGSLWANIGTSGSSRNNYTLVQSTADFPTPVSGVITLAANHVYELNGTIALSDQINLNGSYIIGQNVNVDRLIYSGSSALFTGDNGGTIKLITMVAASGKVFDLDASSNAGQSLLLRDCIIANSSNVGNVKGYSVVFTDVINFSGNTTGVTFEDISALLINNTAWFSNNQGTFETYVGTFNTIAKLGGIMQVSSGATGVDVTGVTTISGAAEIKNTVFSGAGTYINGTFSNEWDVEAGGVETVSDDEANGALYISTSAVTNIATQDTPIKVVGTTTAVNLDRMSSTMDNRLVYTGIRSRKFEMVATLSFSSSSNNQNISFYLAVNGVVQAQTRQQRKTGSSGDIGSVSLSGILELNTNDYVEVWVENNSGNANVTAKFMNLAIK